MLSLLLLSIPLFSRALSSKDPLFSPMSSVSYYGRFSDVFANPAALPLIETDTGPFAVSVSISDDYDPSDFSSSLPLLQNQRWDIAASFVADYVALTAFYGTKFDRYEDASSVYDVRSSLRLELDMAYAIPYLSFGLRVSGGNSMIRQSRTIDNLAEVFANAWFSPFERESGSESFDVGAGAIFSIGPFSLGAYVGKIITLEDNDIYLGWDAIGDSTTLSAALGMGRFAPSGDLRFCRPKLSFSLTGLTGDDTKRSIEAEAELTFQFLPESSATLAVSYFEENHSFFHFDPHNGYVNIFLRGEGEGFTGTIGVSFSAVDFSHFAPYVGFSYIS